ncbi:two-component system, chemotaxis family, response regulator CheB [Malonomonas rubra DSM 5091]|uniref:Protein-glutamate methylesterase/protein-glutamine glutaminase n=1 Tax=Malonomonas rubra DSM 5091 TaxID=1122189 RepID=A0A1M6GAE9_MALRU|nr:chemotaxis response regulator protein-glutamate methylesterase [Malonomonas rubra]SHJ06902.1 two-component system, chemotaxis family, response regulator CheB [Malonomonas rubra DSM 5091]
MAKVIRVLVVDDSALVRNILSQGLSLDPNIEVVGTASDPYIARDKIIELNPDVLTLDVEMPRMDGVAFLRKLMPQFPIPTIMVSSLTQRGKQITIDALDAGAVDFVAKPTSNVSAGLNAMLMELRAKVKIASTANVSHWKGKRVAPKPQTVASNALAESTDKVIAIGASTGGTEAIRRVVEEFPVQTPGVVIVQHMPGGFTKMFADRLNQLCQMEVREAKDGDRVRSGLILIAPGGVQLKVIRSGGFYQVRCSGTDKVSGHCPSVDVMMNSVAQNVGKNAIGAMLTGMGADGAEGMLAMKNAGARCIAQDEATSVVFGMPKVAYEKGGASKLVPLEKIASSLLGLLT